MSDLVYRYFEDYGKERPVGFECEVCSHEYFFTGEDADLQEATGRKVTCGKVTCEKCGNETELRGRYNE